jgi:hypothetical protein
MPWRVMQSFRRRRSKSSLTPVTACGDSLRSHHQLQGVWHPRNCVWGCECALLGAANPYGWVTAPASIHSRNTLARSGLGPDDRGMQASTMPPSHASFK